MLGMFYMHHSKLPQFAYQYYTSLGYFTHHHGRYWSPRCGNGFRKMMPGLEDVTSPAGLLKFLQAVASHTRRVYLATDEVHVKDYAEVLAAGGFECYTRDFLYDFASEKELQDNYFLFAIEMKIIDDATITVRSFNDATPFWFSADARSAKPCYHLLDRSMHDYLLGSSALGTHMTPRCTAPIDLTTSPETLYRVLMSGDDVPRSPTTVPRRRRKEAPPPTAIALEGRGGVRRPCSVWPLGAADSNDARYEAEVEIVGPWDDTEGMLIWGSYFGPLFSCCDAVDGLTRRSTLFGFENLSMEHCKLTECEIARKTGAVFIYVSCGATTLTDQYGVLELHAGQYGVTMAPVHLCLAKGTRLVAIHSEPFTALRSFGGPVEPQGRLRYVDGCSDTLLLAPPKLADPCMNLLHFPPGIRQTPHTHPSLRCGLIASGSGYCMEGSGKRIDLEPGMVWAIPSGTIHSFHTDSDELNVIAYHPDTDWGPMDENHPMLNRTWVDGEKIDNTRGRHERADLFQTEQSLVQLLWTYPIQRLELDERDEAKQMQERSWNFGIDP